MKTRIIETDAGKVEIAVQMKSRAEIEKQIKMLESDPRLEYPTANVFSNAPLALMQTSLQSQIDTLQWVLNETEE